MKKYTNIALITILIVLILNAHAFANSIFQNYAGQAVAEAAEKTAELNRSAGGVPESATLLFIGAGILIAAIYIRKRWIKKEG
ncbi:MAG: hypothetical protein WA277_11755 [Nitrospirota bacterium]